MAAPIAHIFLALQMLAGPWKDKFDHQQFIVGTSFPDIRYLKCVERCATHVDEIDLDQIAAEQDSFKAGLLFHSWVDLRREEFFKQHALYERFPSHRFAAHAVKFAEDELLRPYVKVSEFRAHFDDILPEEQAYDIAPHYIKGWHTFIQRYSDGAWNGGEILMNYFDLNMPKAWFFQRWYFWWAYARPAERTIAQAREDTDFKAKILDFYQTICSNQ